MNINTHSPKTIFIIYIFVSAVLIMSFRFIFPGAAIPLAIYANNWRFIQGALAVFNLFPALVFSALVLPFGLGLFEEDYQSFSQVFFKRLITSVLLAIIAAVIYCIITFFALPMIRNQESNIRFRGDIYHLARENAYLRSSVGQWQEAMHFLDISNNIWPDSPELRELRADVEINLRQARAAEADERALARAALARDNRRTQFTPSGDITSFDATQAFFMAQEAFNERRFFDAHWLAVMGERLALHPRSPLEERNPAQAQAAARLAAEAWNQISSLAPSRREERLSYLFEKKLSGYRAMNSGDWIHAYYIFLELAALTPDDPDVANFLALSEEHLQNYAFFVDEINLSLGEILTGALFSIPGQRGRAVMRFSNLSVSNDYAYGMGFEYMEFDVLLRPVASLRAVYVKLLPVTINDRPQIMILTHALNRYDSHVSWEAEWLIGEGRTDRIIVDSSFEDFLLLAQVRDGLNNLQVNELFNSARRLGFAGHVSQIFEVEILSRFGSAVFFLPMSILVIVLGWRYRARKKPRYFFVLLLPVLPVVFHGLTMLYRTVLNSLSIWLVLSAGFSFALTVYIVFLAVSLLLSLIILSAQHS